jgi:hypothetical protein
MRKWDSKPFRDYQAVSLMSKDRRKRKFARFCFRPDELLTTDNVRGLGVRGPHISGDKKLLRDILILMQRVATGQVSFDRRACIFPSTPLRRLGFPLEHFSDGSSSPGAAALPFYGKVVEHHAKKKLSLPKRPRPEAGRVEGDYSRAQELVQKAHYRGMQGEYVDSDEVQSALLEDLMEVGDV